MTTMFDSQRRQSKANAKWPSVNLYQVSLFQVIGNRQYLDVLFGVPISIYWFGSTITSPHPVYANTMLASYVFRLFAWKKPTGWPSIIGIQSQLPHTCCETSVSSRKFPYDVNQCAVGSSERSVTFNSWNKPSGEILPCWQVGVVRWRCIRLPV